MKKLLLMSVALTGALLVGCGPKPKPYKKKPAYKGKAAQLPAVPTLPNKAKKDGDAYTIWGAVHDLRSVVHAKDFDEKKVKLVGWVIKTNYSQACKDELKRSEGEDHCVPKCAVHKTGKADPADCNAPVPTFWIADTKDEKDWKSKAIAVKGWASNFAQIFTLVEALDKDDEAKLADEFFGMDLMVPLPNVGGRIKVTGNYGVTYNKSTGGTASNPRVGIMTWDSSEWLTVPPKRAVLPGMRKLRNPDNK